MPETPGHTQQEHVIPPDKLAELRSRGVIPVTPEELAQPNLMQWREGEPKQENERRVITIVDRSHVSVTDPTELPTRTYMATLAAIDHLQLAKTLRDVGVEDLPDDTLLRSDSSTSSASMIIDGTRVSPMLGDVTIIHNSDLLRQRIDADQKQTGVTSDVARNITVDNFQASLPEGLMASKGLV